MRLENQIRQTENKAYVIGLLKEKKIEFKPSKKGRLMAIGHLVVVVNTELGKGEVKVKVQQFADKKDGSANSLYKGLQTVAQTYKSIAEVGEAEADLIKIEGQLVDEAYYSVHKGDFVERLEIKGTFINRLTERETPHCCKVGFEGYLSKITPKNDELEVEIIGIGYEGVAVTVTGMIPSHLVVPFQQRYTVGCTATLNFAIVNEVELKQVQAEVGFGEGLGEVIETHKVKRVIFGGGTPLYAGTENALKEEVVKQGLALRQAKLEEKKTEAINKPADTGMTQGFGGVAPQGGVNGTIGTMRMNGTMPIGGGFPTGGGFPAGGAFPQ